MDNLVHLFMVSHQVETSAKCCTAGQAHPGLLTSHSGVFETSQEEIGTRPKHHLVLALHMIVETLLHFDIFTRISDSHTHCSASPSTSPASSPGGSTSDASQGLTDGRTVFHTQGTSALIGRCGEPHKYASLLGNGRGGGTGRVETS